jgi:hypothetical protein
MYHGVLIYHLVKDQILLGSHRPSGSCHSDPPVTDVVGHQVQVWAEKLLKDEFSRPIHILLLEFANVQRYDSRFRHAAPTSKPGSP